MSATGQWSPTGAALSLSDGVIAHAGIALVAVGADVTSGVAQEVVLGQEPSEELFQRAGRAAAAACSPVSDQRGSAEYKRHVAGVLVTRALQRAAARAAEADRLMRVSVTVNAARVRA